MKNYFTLLLLILSIKLYSQVGINTNNPTATIDINGDLRIRTVPEGFLTDSVLSVDDSGFVHKVKFTIYNTSYKLYTENYDSISHYPQVATGKNSLAMIGAISSGENAVAIGNFTTASGSTSLAIGTSGTTASGESSVAIGNSVTSIGNFSVSVGEGNNAVGNNSTAFGKSNTAQSFVETVMGLRCTPYTPISTISIEPLDRLFVIGNGDSGGGESDALTILKDGRTGIDIDNFETTTSDAKLQVNGYISAILNEYASHVLADTDTTLKSYDFYKLTGDRTVYQKP